MEVFRFFFVILQLWSFAYTNNVNRKINFKLAFFYSDRADNIDEYLQNIFEIYNRRLMKSAYQFGYSVYKVNDFNSFQMARILCNELNEGRLAVIGIGNSPTLDHLSSIAISLDIPFIEIKWDNFDADKHMGSPIDFDFLNNPINMHVPSYKIISAIVDLIYTYRWEYVTILYHESIGLDRIQELVRIPDRLVLPSSADKFRVQVRQLSKNVHDWIYLMKDVKLSGSSHIVVDIDTRYLNDFIRQADEVGLMTSYFHFIFTSLDIGIINFAPPANITAIQIFRPNDQVVKNLIAEWNLKNIFQKKPIMTNLPSDAATIYDTLKLISTVIENNNLVNRQELKSTTVSCQTDAKWKFGPTFKAHMSTTNFTGLTGKISFDTKTGKRNNTILYIVDLAKNGVDLLGYWEDDKENYTTSINILRSYTKEYDVLLSRLNRHLIVTTKLEDPYVMRKLEVDGERLTGNDRYEGYCIDLLEKISKVCGFNYTIRLVEDGMYGSIDADGNWNGLVKELIDKKADLALAALSINYQREQAIDFTKPFLDLGISILYKRPKKETPNLFSFLLPLSKDVWIYMIAAYLGVSFMLFVLARFSPYEWQNPHPCKQDSGIVENQFTLLNTLWFTVGSLMQQGTEYSPQATSVRLISCVWRFFTIILISSYTANLAAFLTTQRMKSPIESAEDLGRQTEIKYGVLKGGSTMQFFKESKIQTYERMWNFMNLNPDVFVNSTENGIQRVKNGGYAFLLESTMNEYRRQRDCDLMQVGGLIDSKGYGIGTPTGSPWRDQISSAILKLQEDSILQFLYTKWWKQKGAVACENTDEMKKDSANELGLANVGGVFVVLVAGLGLSVVAALLEFLWKARKNKNKRLSLKDQLARDCKFALCNYNKTKKNVVFEHAKPSNLNDTSLIRRENRLNPKTQVKSNIKLNTLPQQHQQQLKQKQQHRHLQTLK